jgi:Tol biopolymer transport system component
MVSEEKMRLNQLSVSTSPLRIVLGLTMIVFAFVVVACGSSTTPTAIPLPTVAGQATQPVIAQPTTAITPPTVPPLPTAETPGAVGSSPTLTPTKFAVAVVSPTNTATPKPSATTAPKPVVLSGKIAYTVVTGDAPKYHTVWVANVDGSGAHQILTNASWATLSPDGKSIAYLGNPEGKSAGLYIANADGGGLMNAPIVIDPGVCCLRWSNDGNWIVYALSSRPNLPGGDLYKIKVDGFYKTIIKLGVSGNGTAFSPDGKQIVYSGSLPNQTQLGLMVVSADGGAPRQITTDNGGTAEWSPRGDKIVYAANDNAGHRQVFVINPDGSGKKQLTNGKGNDAQPAWSRDGNFILWRSDQNGTAWAIFVMNADGSNPRKVIDSVAPDSTFWGWESLSVSQ